MAYSRLAAIGKGTANVGTITNPTVLQTMDNIVCFCGNLETVTCSNGATLYTLPNTISLPDNTTYFPCVYIESGTYNIGVFFLSVQGLVKTRQALNNATVCLRGVNVNLNDNFYNNTIGNNDESTMTSPIYWNK